MLKKANISDIVKFDGASLDISFDEVLNELDSMLKEEVSFISPVRFNGRLVNISGVIKLDGRLELEYIVKCYRCLKDIHSRMDICVKENFVDADKNPDTETYTYEGNYIELDKVLFDNIVLNLPMKQVCNEECKGICPKCGTDLNENSCECEEDEINPQMEALKNFFKS